MNITNIFAATLIATSLSITAAYAGDGHKHAEGTGEAHEHKTMPMSDDMKAMQTEMEVIINTEDTTKRKELFAAHKIKMKEMMKKCHPEKMDEASETPETPAAPETK